MLPEVVVLGVEVLVPVRVAEMAEIVVFPQMFKQLVRIHKPRTMHTVLESHGFLYKMVAHFTMRTHGENQALRFVEGIWSHRKSRQFRKKLLKRPILHHTCATCYELPSYISTMV